MNASFFVSNLTAVPLFVTLYCDKRLQSSNLHVVCLARLGRHWGEQGKQYIPLVLSALVQCVVSVSWPRVQPGPLSPSLYNNCLLQ